MRTPLLVPPVRLPSVTLLVPTTLVPVLLLVTRAQSHRTRLALTVLVPVLGPLLFPPSVQSPLEVPMPTPSLVPPVKLPSVTVLVPTTLVRVLLLATRAQSHRTSPVLMVLALVQDPLPSPPSVQSPLEVPMPTPSLVPPARLPSVTVLVPTTLVPVPLLATQAQSLRTSPVLTVLALVQDLLPSLLSVQSPLEVPTPTLSLVPPVRLP
jgi:hypothetical protein